MMLMIVTVVLTAGCDAVVVVVVVAVNRALDLTLMLTNGDLQQQEQRRARSIGL